MVIESIGSTTSSLTIITIGQLLLQPSNSLSLELVNHHSPYGYHNNRAFVGAKSHEEKRCTLGIMTLILIQRNGLMFLRDILLQKWIDTISVDAVILYSSTVRFHRLYTTQPLTWTAMVFVLLVVSVLYIQFYNPDYVLEPLNKVNCDDQITQCLYIMLA